MFEPHVIIRFILFPVVILEMPVGRITQQFYHKTSVKSGLFQSPPLSFTMPELTEILESKPEKEVVKDGGSGTDSDEDDNDSIPELEDTGGTNHLGRAGR